MSILSLEKARFLAERLKIFTQPQRLLILSLLLDNPYSVGALGEVTGIGQPALSQQLAALRRAEIIRGERRSRMIFYDFRSEEERHKVQMLLATLKALPPYGRQALQKQQTFPDTGLEKYGSIFARIENNK
ncbi:metalloregulator ArsR/SmtB family transcription factor [Komagataeibacter europaeus]|uniref:metalloregulator ArsR/SmtB family transcription factor n=1 Tax=Komagataeibacter europaeus TaxID=33995 RepID=UPI00037F941D|nr:metalloregulator ArsR/SmtB family transcription factor [Komagataeibacter europaeus]